MSRDIIEKSLSTYKKYGIELTYEEILQEIEKEKIAKNNPNLGDESK